MKKLWVIILSMFAGFMLGYATMLWTAKVATDDAGKLSDVIRQYSDNNSDSDILEYFDTFEYDKETLLNYCYAY